MSKLAATCTYGRYGFHVDRRSTAERWFGYGRIAWLGVAVLSVGPLHFTVTWPV